MSPKTGNPKGAPPSAVLMVLGSCFSLQFGAALATYLFPYAGTWAVSCLRLGIAGLLLLLIARPKIHRWNRSQWILVMAYGASLAGMNGFFYAAIERIPLGSGVTLEFLGPLLLSAILSSHRRDLLWVVIALLGIGMLGLESLLGEPLELVGALFALIAGGFWMLYILAGKKVSKEIDGGGGLAVAFVFGALLLLIPGFNGVVTLVTDSQLLLFAAGTSLLGSFIPYTLELLALRRLNPGVFSILLSLEPAFAAVLGWILLGQNLGPLKIIAVVLVIIASVGVSRPTLPKRSHPAKPKTSNENGDEPDANT